MESIEKRRYFVMGIVVGVVALYGLQTYGNYLKKSIGEAADRGVREALIEAGWINDNESVSKESLETKILE